MSGPESKLGGLSTSIVAVIAVGGVAGLLALIVVAAIIMDIPKRMKKKKNTGIMVAEEMEKKSMDIEEKSLRINEMGKGAPKVSTTRTSMRSPSQYSSTQVDRSTSPECQCAHPSIVIHPSPVYSSTSTLSQGY
ncbi:hypothetical protein AG0111_0g5641 [Alternaria gaisen]|uniref:Uncharacterized protein n=1 Tax=Alternaria gaisen TaxID=167740 RepID=A0ACB6FN16_9PLEO|nr:hypothetical protein AG0111_0g5641 [Alternaria gaisen]